MEEEKKAEQTEFTVKLTKIDDKEKVKIIREVKNLVANLNLVQVCRTGRAAQVGGITEHALHTGQEVRRVTAPDRQGEYFQGGGRKDQEGPRGGWGHHYHRVGQNSDKKP